MTAAAPPAPALPPPCPADEADWARGFALRQLEMLGELAEIGLDVARAIERRANGPAADAPEAPAAPARVFQGDLALAYSRVSRAVRLTLMLQARLISDLKAAGQSDAVALAAAVAEAAKAREVSDPAYQKKVRVEAIVERLAERQHPDDEDRVDDVLREAAERLDDEDLYGDLLERPLSELVARLCKDLGLDPEWAELAEELWAVREIESGQVGWPLARPAVPSERQRLDQALATLDAAFPSDTG